MVQEPPKSSSLQILNSFSAPLASSKANSAVENSNALDMEIDANVEPQRATSVGDSNHRISGKVFYLLIHCMILIFNSTSKQ